ncbi:DUF262 domain-containing HNH endonuclease family protein [Campylobacter felis]|uniref:DUF262 domain-containing HNH endonuclease family protein n=1 Tax=Campylobacter felis TaxID=2974565 RepID=A0ABT7I4X3_9BACT|nr:DUF262 domain-containing HNH endonuclease family protein [Campylobacter upsaliensis]MDL0108821.1 DUF262 domain-containing HNH endonuclease family protein [Campylobacter felis]MDL0147350.1 DUF262 domain-containing HNH endonuclease family protein [Campylobacter felis]
MAELRAEANTIADYLSKNHFLIPMYQRNYVWGEDECGQLWDDIYHFYKNKTDDDEYFLGSMVIYAENKVQNIIDGQQRTTTLLLLIRALYEKAKGQKKENVDKLKDSLADCLWDTHRRTGEIFYDKTHLKSEVATAKDNEKLESLFKEDIKIDEKDKKLSLYEKNYLYFKRKIDDLALNEPVEWFGFCECLLDDCVILPIECSERDKALRIFNTLNNRGISLSTADILKGIIYANKKEDEKPLFAKEWQNLESLLQDSNYLKKEDVGFLFEQYEHIIRALHEELDTVIPTTLDFWTKKDKLNSKKKNVNFAANEDLITQKESFEFIKKLGDFWANPYDFLDEQGKKYFAILNMFPNKLWRMVVSMCFYEAHKNKESLKELLDMILPQIASYCALGLFWGKGGGFGLFWGFMKANINLKNKKREKIFEKSLNLPTLKMPSLENFIDFSQKTIPKNMRYILAFYALIYDEKQIFWWNSANKNFSFNLLEIEHILPRKWQDNYYKLEEDEVKNLVEQIGNKILIEKKLNIVASNEFFAKKKEHYAASFCAEVKALSKSSKKNWDFKDIEERNRQIYAEFGEFFSGIF